MKKKFKDYSKFEVGQIWKMEPRIKNFVPTHWYLLVQSHPHLVFWCLNSDATLSRERTEPWKSTTSTFVTIYNVDGVVIYTNKKKDKNEK